MLLECDLDLSLLRILPITSIATAAALDKFLPLG